MSAEVEVHNHSTRNENGKNKLNPADILHKHIIMYYVPTLVLLKKLEVTDDHRYKMKTINTPYSKW